MGTDLASPLSTMPRHSEQLYELKLAHYRNLVSSAQDTRIAISELHHDEAPSSANTNIESLVNNVCDYKSSQSITTRAVDFVARRGQPIPFYGTPIMAFPQVCLIVRDFDLNTFNPDNITVQSHDLSDFMKPHPFDVHYRDIFNPNNLCYMDFLLQNQREIIRLASAFQTQYDILNPGAPFSGHSPMMIVGNKNGRQFYAPSGREVRAPAFLIHSLQINGQWQDMSNYRHLLQCESGRLFALTHLWFPPIILLNLDDGGHSFLVRASKEARKLMENFQFGGVTEGMAFAPACRSNLPNETRFWFKIITDTPKAPNYFGREPRLVAQEAELEISEVERRLHCAEHHNLLRNEAQAFAESVCTDERLEKAWKAAVHRCNAGVVDKRIMGMFLEELHQLEQIDFSQDDWQSVDWTKVFPRVDRLARVWALARLEDTSPAQSWQDVTDEDEALESTRNVRS